MSKETTFEEKNQRNSTMIKKKLGSSNMQCPQLGYKPKGRKQDYMSSEASTPTQSEISSHEYTKPGYMKMKDLVNITTHNHKAIYNGTHAAGDVSKMKLKMNIVKGIIKD